MPDRRTIIFGPLLICAATPLGEARVAAARPLAPTPTCGDHDRGPTAAETEGPYFKPRSPERISLLDPGLAGSRLVLLGRVLAPDCRPIAGALLDFWQADGTGAYDNAGYRCRGHQFTDADGRYRLVTVMPGSYPGRTRHIHVKVQARGGPLLTTQLYFPGEQRNRSDPLFRPDLLVTIPAEPEENGALAGFDFVVRTG